jgi:hypothetical protein
VTFSLFSTSSFQVKMSYNNGARANQSTGNICPQPYMFGGSTGYSNSSMSFSQAQGQSYRQESVRDCMSWPLSLGAGSAGESGSNYARRGRKLKLPSLMTFPKFIDLYVSPISYSSSTVLFRRKPSPVQFRSSAAARSTETELPSAQGLHAGSWSR